MYPLTCLIQLSELHSASPFFPEYLFFSGKNPCVTRTRSLLLASLFLYPPPLLLLLQRRSTPNKLSFLLHSALDTKVVSERTAQCTTGKASGHASLVLLVSLQRKSIAIIVD